jgi:hypothetical protein
MFFLALLLTSLTAPHAAQATQPAANNMGVNVLLRIVSASGGRSIAGSDRGNEISARFTTDANLCVSGVGNFALQQPHDFSWEVTARVVRRDGSTVTADVTWRQLEGPDSGAAPRSQTLVLKVEERVVLETFRPGGTPRCATEATLEIEAGRPDNRIMLPSSGAAVSSRPGGRAVGGLGVAAGGGGTGGGGTGGGGAAAGGIGSSGSPWRIYPLREGVPGAALLPPGAPFTIEFWLIHTAPNGIERVEAHDRAENVTAIEKKFGPVAIAGASPPASVTVRIDLRTSARVTNPLTIQLNRDETVGGKTNYGGMSRVSTMPSESEIISLELPASAAYPDRFSIRLKFTKPSKEIPGGLFH